MNPVRADWVTQMHYLNCSMWIYQCVCALLSRCYSCCHLCDCDRPGRNCQIPLPKKRDVSKPRGEGSQSGRQPRFPLQRPGRVPERLQWKPKRVFHVTGDLVSCCLSERRLLAPQDFTLHYEPLSHLDGRGGSRQNETQKRNSAQSFVFFLYILIQTDKRCSLWKVFRSPFQHL